MTHWSAELTIQSASYVKIRRRYSGAEKDKEHSLKRLCVYSQRLVKLHN